MFKVIVSTLAFISLSFSATAMAQTSAYVLPEGSLSLDPIAGEITQVKVFPATAIPCPRGRMCAAVMRPAKTQITLNFALGGCLDKLGPVSFETQNLNDGSVTVYMSALAIRTKASQTARCFVAPTQKYTFELPSIEVQESQINMKFLGVPAL